MKAYRLYGIGDFRYEEVEKPKLIEGTVLVSVKAAGICGSDIPRIYRTGTYSYPLTLGHEFSGIVEAAGDDAASVWLGKRVGVFPLIPCMDCISCRNRQYEMCAHYSYLGSRTDGGFAEYVRVPVWNLMELPDSVTMEQAAMLEPMAVAVHAIRRANVRLSDRVAVCGLGTIGLFLVMFLKEMGCEHILGIGNKQFQKERLEELGIPADNYCDVKKETVQDWIAHKSNGQGVDVFFECVGKNETIVQAVDAVAAGGRVQLVGNPAGNVALPKEVYWKILRRQLTVLGTWNSSFTHETADDWRYVLERLENGRISPEKMITHRFPLERLKEGMLIMRDKREEYGKVMIL